MEAEHIAQLVEYLPPSHSQSPVFHPEHHIKLGAAAHACNASIWEVEAEEPEPPDH